MLNPPPGLSAEELIAALGSWRLCVADLEYLPVGFGTHHWSVLDPARGRWFVNVDELANNPLGSDDSLRTLRDSLSVPRALVGHGCDFVVAPVPNRRGEVLEVIRDEFAVSVYPHLDGDDFEWGPWESAGAGHRQAVLDILAELHAVPRTAWGAAATEGFAIPQRAVLMAVFDGGRFEEAGPYSRRAVELVTSQRAMITRFLRRYDDLAAYGRTQEGRFVLTHGEPHIGNTMSVDGRIVLIDWDTALVGPPERDLWNFGLGDPRLRELYRVRWDLTEVALYLAQFLRRHADAENERHSWVSLVETLESLETTAARI